MTIDDQPDTAGTRPRLQRYRLVHRRSPADAEQALNTLARAGYRLVSTHPSPNGPPTFVMEKTGAPARDFDPTELDDFEGLERRRGPLRQIVP